MALTPFNIFSPTIPANLNKAESGKVITEVAGLGAVETYGHGISWVSVTVPKDNSVITEKRDRFEKRNEFLNAMAEAGEFEYALVVSPTTNGKRIAKCSFCGANHNWVVLYRAKEGRSLGWSGTDCFSEVVDNLGLPAAEAMKQAIKAERTRCEKFRRTMEKINDFKRDFPGLYENRTVLGSRDNPYCNLWWAVRNRLNLARGVDEKWLAECESGAYDRRYSERTADGYEIKVSQDARRIPKFLQWLSAKLSAGMPISEVMRLLTEQYAKELAERQQRAKTGMQQAATQAPAAPAPAPVAPPKSWDADNIQTIARRLWATGKYGWSRLVQRGVNGDIDAAVASHVLALSKGK